MRHHHACMYPRVRTSCPCHLYVLAQDERERTLQLALYGDAVGLHLPPVVSGSVVAEGYEVTHIFLGLMLSTFV